jgi:hypothetical protein
VCDIEVRQCLFFLHGGQNSETYADWMCNRPRKILGRFVEVMPTCMCAFSMLSGLLLSCSAAALTLGQQYIETDQHAHVLGPLKSKGVDQIDTADIRFKSGATCRLNM